MSKDTLDGTVLATPRSPAITDMKQPESCAVNHHRLVNSEAAYPDVQFQFDEGPALEAHYPILQARAPALVADAKQKKKTWVVQVGKGKSKPIPNHSSALFRVLVYVYTGEVDWTTYNPFQAIEVLNLAKSYNLHHLAQINRKFIQDSITQQNVYEVMKYSHRLDVEEVKVLCIDFALHNTEFFTSTRAKELGFDLYQEATAVLVKHYVKKSAPSTTPVKKDAESSIVEDFITVYNARSESGDLVFKLVADKQVKVHKAMLSRLSNELDTLLRNNAQSVVPTRPQFTEHQITYNRLTADAFEAMLKFLYYADKNFSLQHATQLYLFAKDFKLTALVSALDNVMNVTDADTHSVLFMLQIAYIELNDKKDLQQALKTKGLQFVVANLTQIDFKPLDTMPAIIGTSIVEAVQAAVKKQHANWASMKENFSKETRSLPTSTSSYNLVPAYPTSPSPLLTATATSTSRMAAPPGTPPVPTSPPPPITATNRREKEDEESQLEEASTRDKKPARSQKKTDSKKPLAEDAKEKEKDGKESKEKEKEPKDGKDKKKDKKN